MRPPSDPAKIRELPIISCRVRHTPVNDKQRTRNEMLVPKTISSQQSGHSSRISLLASNYFISGCFVITAEATMLPA